MLLAALDQAVLLEQQAPPAQAVGLQPRVLHLQLVRPAEQPQHLPLVLAADLRRQQLLHLRGLLLGAGQTLLQARLAERPRAQGRGPGSLLPSAFVLTDSGLQARSQKHAGLTVRTCPALSVSFISCSDAVASGDPADPAGTAPPEQPGPTDSRQLALRHIFHMQASQPRAQTLPSPPRGSTVWATVRLPSPPRTGPESPFLGRLKRSPGSLRRRKGSGALKQEKRTNLFSSTFQSHKMLLSLSLELMITQQTTQFKLCIRDHVTTMHPT